MATPDSSRSRRRPRHRRLPESASGTAAARSGVSRTARRPISRDGHRPPAVSGAYRLRAGLRGPGKPRRGRARVSRCPRRSSRPERRGPLQPADEALAHRRMGWRPRSAGTVRPGRGALQESTQAQPEGPEDLERRGLQLLSPGAMGRRRAALKTAARLAPDDERIRINLGLTLAAAGQNRGSLAALEPVERRRDRAREPRLLAGRDRSTRPGTPAVRDRPGDAARPGPRPPRPRAARPPASELASGVATRMAPLTARTDAPSRSIPASIKCRPARSIPRRPCPRAHFPQPKPPAWVKPAASQLRRRRPRPACRRFRLPSAFARPSS